MNKALPCISCKVELYQVFDDGLHVNEPSKGTVFTAVGQYGSTVFDPMDESYLEINICDLCLKAAAKREEVLIAKKKGNMPGYHLPKIWDGK